MIKMGNITCFLNSIEDTPNDITLNKESTLDVLDYKEAENGDWVEVINLQASAKEYVSIY